MPRYEFQCPTCGNFGEVTRKMDNRNDPIFCDGAELFETPGEFGESKKHEPVAMNRIMSRLAIARVAGKRYA